MYTEEPKKSINWGNVVKKGLIILLIALVIFFIIWLLTRNNADSIDVDYDDDTNSNKTTETIQNPDAYTESFITNYHYFHDTARDYFLISELPTSGNTIKYTLQELINKGLLLPTKYGDGTCDAEASYVTVKNENGKYTFTTTLVCGREVAKTTEELGCNQLCTNGTCKNNLNNQPNNNNNNTPSTDGKDYSYVTEYKHRQAYTETESVYSCPSGYTKSGTICIKSTEEVTKIKKNITYSCPSGYEKVGFGSMAKCVKSSESTADPVCPDGYTKSGSGSSIKCTKTVTSNKDEYTDPICPDGFTKSGSGSNIKCTKTNTSSNTETVEPDCPAGFTKSGSGANVSCTKTNTTYRTETAKPTFSSYDCSGKGTNLGNGKCRSYSTKRYYKTSTIYYGPTWNGCTYSGAYSDNCGSGCVNKYYKYYCSTSSYTDVNANAIYRCPSGYTPGGNVSASTTCSRSVPSTTTESAASICSQAGFTKNASGMCVKTNTSSSTENADPICPNGYTKSGSGSNIKCSKTNTSSSTESANPVCPKGSTSKDGKCITTTTSTKKVIKNIEYYCPSGYTKVGAGSTAKCTKGSVKKVNATKVDKTVTKYRYKWDRSSSLPGWEFTGETRQVKTSSSEK